MGPQRRGWYFKGGFIKRGHKIGRYKTGVLVKYCLKFNNWIIEEEWRIALVSGYMNKFLIQVFIKIKLRAEDLLYFLMVLIKIYVFKNIYAVSCRVGLSFKVILEIWIGPRVK